MDNAQITTLPFAMQERIREINETTEVETGSVVVVEDIDPAYIAVSFEGRAIQMYDRALPYEIVEIDLNGRIREEGDRDWSDTFLQLVESATDTASERAYERSQS